MRLYVASTMTDGGGNFIYREADILNFSDVLARTSGRPTQELFEEVHIPYEYEWVDDKPTSDFVSSIASGGRLLMSVRAKEVLFDLLSSFGCFYPCTIEGAAYFDYCSWNVIQPYDLDKPIPNKTTGIIRHYFNNLAKSQHYFSTKRHPISFVSEVVVDTCLEHGLTGLKFTLVGE